MTHPHEEEIEAGLNCLSQLATGRGYLTYGEVETFVSTSQCLKELHYDVILFLEERGIKLFDSHDEAAEALEALMRNVKIGPPSPGSKVDCFPEYDQITQGQIKAGLTQNTTTAKQQSHDE